MESGIWLDLSTIPSWRHVVEWYQGLSQPRCVPDAAIRARALELTRDAKTPQEKLKALVAFVSREIQYQTTPFRNSAYVPTLGKQVLRERYGDCKDKAALLTAMLPNPRRRSAKAPRPGVRRIAGTVQARAARPGPIDACLRRS